MEPPDSGWQMAMGRYWDQGLNQQAFRDQVNHQEYSSRSEKRMVVSDPKAEADLQTAYHRMKEYAGSERETRGHG